MLKMACISRISEKFCQTLQSPLWKPLRASWAPQVLVVLSLASAAFVSWPLTLSVGGLAGLSWKASKIEDEAVRRLEREQRKPLLHSPSESLDFPAFYGNAFPLSTHLVDQAVVGLLTTLRKRGRLLTQREFAQKSGCTVCKRSRYISKGYQFERILGADYLARTAKRLGLDHLIRVPIKYAVLDLEDPTVSVLPMEIAFSKQKSISSRDLAIYAEKILLIDRRATRQEMESLFKLILESRFIDTFGRNFILGKNRAGEEGIFFVDTEMDSFNGTNLSGVEGFYSLMASEDHPWLKDQIQSLQQKIEELSPTKDLSFEYDRTSRRIQIPLSEIFGGDLH